MKVEIIQPNLVMIAPMEGVVDPWIRQLISSYGGVDYCVTEFVRVTQQIIPDKIFYEYAPELKTESKTLSGTPVFVQLLGSDLNFMAENAAKAVKLGAYGIDINFGCPAKTVNKNDGGSVILKNPERVFQITNAVRQAVPAHIPVNAKVRLGYEHKDFHKEIALAAEEAGAGWLVVHARTKMDGYKPPAYWDFIKSMQSVVNIPVVANGEIWNVPDYHKCREQSGSRDVMIGRGFMAEPLLGLMIQQDRIISSKEANTFNEGVPTETFASLDSGVTVDLKNEQDVIKFYLKSFVLKYIEICPKKETNFLVGRSKQLIKLLCRNHPSLNPLFEAIKPCQNFTAIAQKIQEFTETFRYKNTIKLS